MNFVLQITTFICNQNELLLMLSFGKLEICSVFNIRIVVIYCHDYNVGTSRKNIEIYVKIDNFVVFFQFSTS